MIPFLFIMSMAFADTLEFIDSRTDPKWTTLIYTKTSGEMCKLNMKLDDLKKIPEIERWLDHVSSSKCAGGNDNWPDATIRLD